MDRHTCAQLWFADPLNYLELCAWLAYSAGLSIRLSRMGSKVADLGDGNAALAVGLLLAWTSQMCRLLLRSARLGPLVLMTQKMILVRVPA